ncbi:MAG: hypothetical protein MZV70_66670 [Desulfobacterales bacterium]|nr:hypothetical protein [Desulfobacterales bacterium]
MSAVLRWSRCARTKRRFSRMVSPGTSGKPPRTMRRGSPAVWASRVVIRSRAVRGRSGVRRALAVRHDAGHDNTGQWPAQGG